MTLNDISERYGLEDEERRIFAEYTGNRFAEAEEAEQAARLLREAMEGAMELRVPLVAEVHQGKNWAEAK